MAGIETLARLAGVEIPGPVRFALNPTAYILGEIYKQIESSAGLPSKTLQTIANPAGAAADYIKTEAGNAALDQSNMSNIERILKELQPSQFEQARAAGETPASVPSSIEMPAYDPDSLAGLGSLEIPNYLGGGEGNGFAKDLFDTGMNEPIDVGGFGGGDYTGTFSPFGDFGSTVNYYTAAKGGLIGTSYAAGGMPVHASGGQTCGCKR